MSEIFYDPYTDGIDKNSVIFVDSFFNTELDIDPNLLCISVNAGEDLKCLDQISSHLNKLTNFNINTSNNLVAIGGGTVTDYVGFLASIYMRGIPWTAIPTTLVGMCDAAIGGKTGINFNNIKNLVGTVYNPTKTIIDSQFQKYWSENIISDGHAEMFKMKLVYEHLKQIPTKNRLLRDELSYVQKIKKYFINTNQREFLNFGHTIGHALERQFKISHGNAVWNGMYYESILFKPKWSQFILTEMEKYNVNLLYIENEIVDDLVDLMLLDKKNTQNKISFWLDKEYLLTKDQLINSLKTT